MASPYFTDRFNFSVLHITEPLSEEGFLSPQGWATVQNAIASLRNPYTFLMGQDYVN